MMWEERPREGQSLQYDLLESLLTCSPCSLAAMYGDLIRLFGYPPGLHVGTVTQALRELELRGWVRAQQMAEDASYHPPTDEERARDLAAYEDWLPRADWRDPSQFAADEVGLWYEITAQGRIQCSGWVYAENSDELWTVRDDAAAQTLTIHAQDLEQAEELLGWCVRHKDVDLVGGSVRIQPVRSFRLRAGTVVSGGQQLECRYRRFTEPDLSRDQGFIAEPE